MARTDGLVKFTLHGDEAAELMSPVRGDGGWQRLMQRLQDKFDKTGNCIELEDKDVAKVFRYLIYDGVRGGFQRRMNAIFGRSIRERLPL